MPARAAREPEVRAFTATVEAVADDGVVLDETYFYPEGGGQPADRGTIDGVAVTDVQKREGRVVHTLAEPSAVAEGAIVEASVDDAFRTYCMRAHTASHLLYGAGRRLLEDLGYGGFDIAAGPADEPNAVLDRPMAGKVRVDLATPTPIDDDVLVDLERLTNLAVFDDRAVTWETVAKDDALAREDVAFNTKTEEGLAGDTVRIVTIEDWDVAACGGTHVARSVEVGPVTVLDRSNPGEGLTRVEFTVGAPAVARRAAERREALAAATALDTRVAELTDAVARLRDERDAAEDALQDARAELVDSRVAALRDDVVEDDGSRWLVGTLPGLDANALADRAQSVLASEDDLDVVAFVGDDGGYLAVATTGDVEASDVVAAVTDAFGGGGGGGPTVAQGGGLEADPAAVVDLLRTGF